MFNPNTHNNSLFNLPDNLEIGQAIADGSCFFDSFMQGLQRLQIAHEDIDSLRKHCKEFAENNPPNWFINAIGNSHQLNSIRRETALEYMENIQRTDRWGDPDIEGRILCQFYNVFLYVIEKQQVAGNEVYAIQLIDEHGCQSVDNIDYNKPRTIFIINQGQGHFEPIINKRNQNIMSIPNQTNLTQNHTNITQPTLTKPTRHTTASKYKFNDTKSQKLTSTEKRLVIDCFDKFKDAIKKGDVERLRGLINILYNTVDKTSIKVLYEDKENSIRQTHLITIACKYNQRLVLDFLLHKSNILCYLPDTGIVVQRAYMQAICETMQSYNFELLEMLYDYWTSDMHWFGLTKRSDANNIIHNLKQLRKHLIKAQINCSEHLKQNDQMTIDVICLTSFNEFQIALYTALNSLKINIVNNNNDERKTEVERIRDVLQTALNVYVTYTSKNIMKEIDSSNKLKTKLGCQDGICYMCYLLCEVYYRRLDFNIALLIVNNLHLLKLRLAMPSGTYQEIESTIYYFLHRVNENWNFYLPENAPKLRVLSYCKEEKFKFLEHSYYCNGPVIYQEWRKYLKSMTQFKKALVNQHNDLRVKGTKLPKEEINNLLPLPYLRDDYSLKKILQYMENMSFVDFKRDRQNSILIIQRIIQITGEFIKGTKDSYHLSPITLGLLKVEIPNDALKYLSNLRDHFSHPRAGRLIRRIDLEQNESDLFEKLFKDLQKIQDAIIEVLKVYKPVLNKYMVILGQDLLHNQMQKLPREAMLHKDAINEMFANYVENIATSDYVLYTKMEKDFIVNYNLTAQQIRQIGFANININHLEKKISQNTKKTNSLVMKKLPKFLKYFNSIQHEIAVMEKENEIWELLKQDLENIQFSCLDTILDYPNTECITKIRSELKNMKVRNKKDPLISVIKKKLSAVSDRSMEWQQIKALITFIISQGDFDETTYGSIIDLACCSQCTSKPGRCAAPLHSPGNAGLSIGRQLITWLTSYWETSPYNNGKSTTVQSNDNFYEYKELKALADKMSKIFFLTYKEMDILKNDTHDISGDDLIQKLYSNSVINEKEYEIVSPKLNEKCKRIIANLTNGNTRSNNMLECLVNRIKYLNAILDGDREQDNLILRYKHDAKFRIMIEMVLSDVMNIYIEVGLPELANTIHTKLLAEYPIRHILEHGNPLLDVCSFTLDHNDFPSALVNFALNVVHDEVYIDILYELYENGVKYAQVKSDILENLNDGHKKLIIKFKECSKWDKYAKRFYDSQQSSKKKKKKNQ